MPVNRTWERVSVHSVQAQGCRYLVPWVSPVLPLAHDCQVLLPRCGPGDSLTFVVESIEALQPLWTMQWDDTTFSAQRVDDGLWLTLNSDVFVMSAVPSNTFVTVTVEFHPGGLALTHSLDPFGVLWLPLNLSSIVPHSHAQCTLGPMPSVALHSFQYKGEPAVRGLDLLNFVKDPSVCELEGRDLQFQSPRWLMDNSSQAWLFLEPRDLVRCQPSGTSVDLSRAVCLLELQDKAYRTLGSLQLELT